MTDWRHFVLTLTGAFCIAIGLYHLPNLENAQLCLLVSIAFFLWAIARKST